jgi:hypothetical protein
MTQLSYEPAYDVYHTIFRILRLLAVAPEAPLRLDQLRILDFFLLFPMLLHTVRLPRPSAARTALKKLASDNFVAIYAELPSPVSLFRSMTPFQELALETLHGQGYLDARNFPIGKAIRTSHALPEELADTVAARNAEQQELMDFLADHLMPMPFEGEGGLKDRSGLLEYRYDAI